MEIILNSPNNPIFFHIFNYPVRYYGIILSFAIFSGLFLSEYLIKLKYDNKTLETFQDSIPIMIISSIIGARIFYIVGSFDFYLNNPQEIIKINHGGISILGAIFFGMLTFFIYSKIKSISFLKYIDFYALTIPFCQSIGRFGNYFNQEAYGAPSDGLFKLFIDKSHRLAQYIDVEYYHPTFLYESILDFIIFVILFLFYKNIKNLKQGTIFSLYLIFYALTRIFIENIRLDSVLNIGNTPIATILSLITLIIGVVTLILINKGAQKI